MKLWVVYGIIAAVAYGVSAIPLKYAISRNFLATPFHVVVLGSLIGGIITLFVYIGAKEPICLKSFIDNKLGLVMGICSGAIGVIGTISIVVALKHPQTDISRMMAIVSTSVLITALGGMFILGEVPSTVDRLRVLVGICLLAGGVKLVTG